MILVDSIQSGPTPWPGGRFSHLISDDSVRELLDFSQALGLPLSWFQHRSPGSLPHFDVSPGWRAKAIRAGACPVDKRGFVEGMRRYCERNPGPWTRQPLL